MTRIDIEWRAHSPAAYTVGLNVSFVTFPAVHHLIPALRMAEELYKKGHTVSIIAPEVREALLDSRKMEATLTTIPSAQYTRVSTKWYPCGVVTQAIPRPSGKSSASSAPVCPNCYNPCADTAWQWHSGIHAFSSVRIHSFVSGTLRVSLCASPGMTSAPRWLPLPHQELVFEACVEEWTTPPNVVVSGLRLPPSFPHDMSGPQVVDRYAFGGLTALDAVGLPAVVLDPGLLLDLQRPPLLSPAPLEIDAVGCVPVFLNALFTLCNGALFRIVCGQSATTLGKLTSLARRLTFHTSLQRVLGGVNQVGLCMRSDAAETILNETKTIASCGCQRNSRRIPLLMMRMSVA